ncbi:MAG: RNA polymerase factor sigma-32 [Deltaproteobacteria bacterium]|nr:RNA polymerase factor sigma-32 [Deltaproteobacteria bacterium]
MNSKNRHSELASPYQLYLAELQKYPVLSAEEEKDLAYKYFENEDKIAAHKLVMHNLKFVVSIANKYSHYGLRIMDLIQEGNLGLLKALQTFNPYKDVRFITYAVWWIRSYIHEYIQKNWSIVKVVTTQAQRQLFYKLKREHETLEKMGYEPTSKLIAQRLQLPEKDVKTMQERLFQPDVSLDSPLKEGRTTSHLERMANNVPLADVALEHEEQKRLIAEKLEEFKKTLLDKKKDLYIFEKRVVADKPQTLAVIGNKFKISRERVRQIENRVKKQLKLFFIRELPDYVPRV